MDIVIPEKQPGDDLLAGEVNQIVQAVNIIGEQINEPSYALSGEDFLLEGTVVIGGHVVPLVKLNPDSETIGNGGGNTEPTTPPQVIFQDDRFVVTQNGSNYNVDLHPDVIAILETAASGGNAEDPTAEITAAINTLRGGYGGTLQDLKTLIDNIGSGNTTPIAPVAVADDNADTLAYTHALGTGELETSTNGGAYAAYAPINVGNVDRVQGYYKTRVRAATGRNASAYTESPAFTTASGGGSSAIAIPKILLGGGAATLAGGDITVTGDNTRIVIANDVDGPTFSTLAISAIEMGYHSSWNTNYIFLGLGTPNYGEAYGNIQFAMLFSKDNGMITGKIVVGNTDIAFNYTLPLATTTRIRVRAVKDTTYWRVFFEVSTNSGGTYSIINPAGLGGQAGALSAVPIATNLFGQIPGSINAVYKTVKYLL